MAKTTKRKKKVLNPRVAREYCDGTMTKSAFFGAIRAFLRRQWMFSSPTRKQALKKAYIESLEQYLCAQCNKPFDKKMVEVNHKIPCGSLKDYEDIKPFHDKLFTSNVDELEIVCKTCHLEITKKDKNDK